MGMLRTSPLLTYSLWFVLLLMPLPALWGQEGRRRDMPPWEAAYEDFIARYPDARLYGAPSGSEEVVILFRQADQAAYATYDAKGRWQGTVTWLRHAQLPVGPLKLMAQIGVTFETYVRIEQPGGRPRFGLMARRSTWVMHPYLLSDQGLPGAHVFSAVGMSAEAGAGLSLVWGEAMMDTPPEARAWTGVALTADGVPCTSREISSLARAGLLYWPAEAATPSWTPPLHWRLGQDYLPLPGWQPDPAWHSGEAPGALPFTTQDSK